MADIILTNPSKITEARRHLFDKWQQYLSHLPEKLSIEEAVEEAGIVSLHANAYEEASMIAKFFLGILAHKAHPEWRSKRAYGEDIIGTIAEAKGIHPNTLREARRVSEFFGFDFKLYYEWLTENDDPKKWYNAQGLIRAHSSTDVHGPDNLSNILAGQITRAGLNMQSLREMADRGEISYDEVRGVEQAFLDELRSFDSQKDDILKEDDPAPHKSKDYYLWLKEKPCQVTGATEDVHVHHVEQGGVGETGSDYSGVPVYWEVHNFIETQGHKAAEEKYNIKFGQIIASLLHEYLVGRSMRFPQDISWG